MEVLDLSSFIYAPKLLCQLPISKAAAQQLSCKGEPTHSIYRESRGTRDVMTHPGSRLLRPFLSEFNADTWARRNHQSAVLFELGRASLLFSSFFFIETKPVGHSCHPAGPSCLSFFSPVVTSKTSVRIGPRKRNYRSTAMLPSTVLGQAAHLPRSSL